MTSGEKPVDGSMGPTRKGDKMSGGSMLHGKLDGKRVLIIGGGNDGIGGAISRRVAQAGASHLAIIDLDHDRAEAATDAASVGLELTALPLVADVRSAQQVADAVAVAAGAFGGLDVLITVVGGAGTFAPWRHLHNVTDEEWDLLLDLNIRYVFYALRAALPIFMEGGGGTIVSLGSHAGTTGVPLTGAYGAAKAGLANLAKTVSAEYGPHGVRMNVVHPGMILTPGARRSLPDVTLKAMSAAVPARRLGTPDDIAHAVVFMSSDQSGYLFGQAIEVDGGASAASLLPPPQPTVL